ncbi:MAG: ATP-binding protein, partial [Campylobacteraceae bacterium]|nr:ATP-binding protein [Campylobacteraceae bacterium]
FVFMYRIKSLSNIKKYSVLLVEKNIKTTDKTLNFVKKILIKSHYSGNIFYETENKLLYSTFLRRQRLFVIFGINETRINDIINLETKTSNMNLQKKIVSLVLSIILITFIFFLLSYLIAKKIEKIFQNYRLKVINNERKYQLLFNHSNDGFIISKITSNKKAIIISTNTLAKKLTEYGLDLIGKNFFELFSKFDKKTLFRKNEILDKALLNTKHNLQRHIELSCVLYQHDEETLLFSSLRDISERVQLKIEKENQEKLLIQKSKMASMGEMIGNIAHQWRQPISQLSGLFFDIESAYDYGELNKEYLSKRIDEADDLVEYMSKTIDDFKEFYNPNSKKEKFYLADNIEKTLKIINSSFKYHNIEVHLNIDKNICIEGYSSEFSQVLLNILSNSKEIALIRDIKKPKIQIFSQTKKKKIVLHIEDNCGGIEEEILDKIFEPYFTTKYNYGTGIGLYMSKIIIENKMKGVIFAKNTKTKGARFTIVL